jgi:hypothetical protein
MKLLALLVGFYGGFGFAGAATAATMQDPRGQPFVFGISALIMGISGLRAARSIWRCHPSAERRLYIWGLATIVMFVSLAVAFPYAFAERANIWPPTVTGLLLFALLVAAGGRFIRHRVAAV